MVIYFKNGSEMLIKKEQFVRITRNGITVISANLLNEDHYSWEQVEKVIK